MSSAAWRDSAVKLTPDSYHFWVAHLNLRVTFNRIYSLQEKCQNMVMRFQSPLVYFENCQKYAFHVFLETMKNGYKYLVAPTPLDNFQTFCFKNYPAKHRVTGQNN